MIDQILPDWVAISQSRRDCWEHRLFPEERAVIANALPERRAEFATVRHCARVALAELGVSGGPILPGEQGAPQWPVGIVGSMTHCLGFRAAAVASERCAVSIGLDAEPHEALPDGVFDVVARPEERAQLADLKARQSDVHWDRLLFTMKESIYKAWYPLTHRWLDFLEASVSIDSANRRFIAELLVPGPLLHGVELTSFKGRFLVRDGLAMSAIVVATCT